MLTVPLILLFIFALFLAVTLAAWRWLLPGLALAPRRVALLFLAAQTLTIGMAALYKPQANFEFWLWHLDREWNIPAALASAQLAQIACVSLLIAVFASRLARWQRAYYFALCLVFLLLAYDEYAVLHEYVYGWKSAYFILGIVLALATVGVSAFSPRARWKWHFWLLTGLACSALGGLVVEANCGQPIFEPIGLCENHFFVEEPLEFFGMWLALAAMLGLLNAMQPSSRRLWRALRLFPALWLLLLAASPAIHPIADDESAFRPADVAYESGLRLRGYRLGKDKDDISLLLSPAGRDFYGKSLIDQGYSVHLVDQASGLSLASQDEIAHRRRFRLAPGYAPVYVQWVDIQRPESTPRNRAMWLVLTLWREEDGAYLPERIRASDHRLLGEAQVVLAELVLPAAPETEPPAEPLAAFENGFFLDAVELPQQARASQPLVIAFSWRAAAPGSEDLVQFLHLGHDSSGEWRVFDRPPLGERLPTRLWHAGLAETEQWQVALPADLAPGRYSLFSGLYRASDRERLPVRKAAGDAFLDYRVPLGRLVVEGA